MPFHGAVADERAPGAAAGLLAAVGARAIEGSQLMSYTICARHSRSAASAAARHGSEANMRAAGWALALLVLATCAAGDAAGLDACPVAGFALVSRCEPQERGCTVSAVKVGGWHSWALLSHGGLRLRTASPSAGHAQAPLRLHLRVPVLKPSPRGLPRCWCDPLEVHVRAPRCARRTSADSHTCALLDDGQLCVPPPPQPPPVFDDRHV